MKEKWCDDNFNTTSHANIDRLDESCLRLGMVILPPPPPLLPLLLIGTTTLIQPIIITWFADSVWRATWSDKEIKLSKLLLQWMLFGFDFNFLLLARTAQQTRLRRYQIWWLTALWFQILFKWICTSICFINWLELLILPWAAQIEKGAARVGGSTWKRLRKV